MFVDYRCVIRFEKMEEFLSRNMGMESGWLKYFSERSVGYGGTGEIHEDIELLLSRSPGCHSSI